MGKKYTFSGMEPYAAIIDETQHKLAIGEYKAKNFKETVGKDLIEGAISTVGEKLKIKTFSSKKYWCVNLAGRKFATYFEDIPAVLIRRDGKVSDVKRNDDLFPLLGEPIAPTINIVDALYIKAKEIYLFYGAGIQINNATAEYERLCMEINLYEAQKKAKKVFVLPGLPAFGKKDSKEGLFLGGAHKKGLMPAGTENQYDARDEDGEEQEN